eukprot:gene22213-29276_t
MSLGAPWRPKRIKRFPGGAGRSGAGGGAGSVGSIAQDSHTFPFLEAPLSSMETLGSIQAFLSSKDNLIKPMEWELSTGAAIGLSLDQFRFTLSMLLALPLSLGVRIVPTQLVRNLYILLTGFFLTYYPFGFGCIHALVTGVLTYIAMLALPKHCGTISWLINFPYLIYMHVVNASGESWARGEMDFTGCQMIVTLKLISIAVGYQDSRKKKEDLETNLFQAEHALYRMPSLLEFSSYLFCSLLCGPYLEFKFGSGRPPPQWYLASSASGRLSYLEAEDPFPSGAWPHLLRGGSLIWKQKTPSPVVPGLVCFGEALLFAALYMLFAGTWNRDILFSEWYSSHGLLLHGNAAGLNIPSLKALYPCLMGADDVDGDLDTATEADLDTLRTLNPCCSADDVDGDLDIATEAGLDTIVTLNPCCIVLTTIFPCYPGSLLWIAENKISLCPRCCRVLTMFMVTLTLQLKLAFAWKLSETALTLSGVNFTGYVKQDDGSEKATCARLCPGHWNIQTGVWLRRCVYERITPKGKKPGFVQLMTTQLASAIWHGLSPGYLMFFASTALLSTPRQSPDPSPHALLPTAVATSIPMRAVKILWTHLSLNYLATAFVVLDFRNCLRAYSTIYYLPHVIMLVGGFVLPMVSGKGRRSKKGEVPPPDSKKTS